MYFVHQAILHIHRAGFHGSWIVVMLVWPVWVPFFCFFFFMKRFSVRWLLSCDSRTKVVTVTQQCQDFIWIYLHPVAIFHWNTTKWTLGHDSAERFRVDYHVTWAKVLMSAIIRTFRSDQPGIPWVASVKKTS